MWMRGVVLAVALSVATGGFAAEEVIGVAKPGDGSAVANAWADWNKTRPSNISIKGSGAGMTVSSSSGNVPGGNNQPGPAPDWVMHVKSSIDVGNKMAERPDVAGIISNSFAMMKDAKVIFVSVERHPTDTWIEFRKHEQSGRSPLEEQVGFTRALLEKAGEPMTVDQEKKLRSLINATLKSHGHDDLMQAWEKVEANPADLELARAFLAALNKALDVDKKMEFGSAGNGTDLAKSEFDAILAIFTPQQRNVFDGAMEGTQSSNIERAANGSEFSETVISHSGKQTVTFTFKAMPAKDVLSRVTKSVHQKFNATLAAEFDAALAETQLSATLVIEKPEDALPKLAVAAGAKVETRDGKVILVPAK
jgi:hypothetical protein